MPGQCTRQRRRLRSGRLGLARASADGFPGYAQRMQDELIVEAKLGRIHNGFPSVHDVRIAGDAPRFVANDAFTMLARSGGVTVALKPGIRLSS